MGRNKGIILRQDLTDLMWELDISVDNFVADRILPTIPVKTTAGNRPILPREELLKIPDTSRASNGTYARGSWNWDTASFSTELRGYEEPVDIISAQIDADYVDDDVISTKLAIQKLLLADQKRVADAVYNTSTFTGSTGYKALTTEWSDVDCTPRADIETVFGVSESKNGFAKSQHSLIMNRKQLFNVMASTELQGSSKYTKNLLELGTPAQVAWLTNYLELKEIIVVDQSFDASGLNLDFSVGKMYSNEYMMLAVLSPSIASWKTPGLGRQPEYDKLVPSSWRKPGKKVLGGVLLEEYDAPEADQYIIRAKRQRGISIDANYGVLIGNVTA